MRIRDRIVIVVLVVSLLIAAVLWHVAGRWVALVVVVAGVLLGALVYRLRSPAFGLNDRPLVPGVTAPATADQDPSRRQ